MHHNVAMLTKQVATPKKKLANRSWLTFSFLALPNSGCQSIPYLIYTAVPFPDNDGAKMQHPGDRESLLFTVATKILRRPKQFLIFEESRNWPVWEMNSMFHIKSLGSNLNTLWRPPSFHFVRSLQLQLTLEKHEKVKPIWCFLFNLNKIGVFMASTWNSIGVTTTCKLDQSSSSVALALHLCWAMTIPEQLVMWL